MLGTPSNSDVTERERTMEENVPIDADTFDDQDWDIHSPLLILNTQPQNDNNVQVLSSLQIDTVESSSLDDGVDPYSVFLEICSVVTMILFLGLTAGSFFYPWLDTNLKFLLGRPNGLPFDVNLPLFVDTTFAHIFEMFQSSHSMYAIRMISLVSFLLPSLCFVCQFYYHVVLGSLPSTGYKDEATCRNAGTATSNGLQILKSELCAYWHSSIVMPRNTLQLSSVPLYIVKFSMTLAYVILIHEVVLSHVHFAVGGDFSPKDSTVLYNTTSTKPSYLYARVVSEIRGGLVAYMIGVTLGSYSFMIIKTRFLSKCQNMCIQQSDEDESSDESTDKPFFNQGSFVSPPPLAFRMLPTYNEISSSNVDQMNVRSYEIDESYEVEHNDGLSTPLLRHLKKEVENHPLQQVKSENNRDNGTLDNLEVSITSTRHKVCWRDIFSFECCLLSVVLVLPLISEPLVTFHYNGALVHVFEESVGQVFTCTFWELIMAVTKCRDKDIFSVTIAIFLWFHVIILPFLCWICHAVTLLCMAIGKYDTASTFIVFAKFMHPLHHMAPFAISVLVASRFMGDVSKFLFDQNVFCDFVKSLFNDDTDGKCLEISMTLHPAMFVLLSQVFTTDIFMALVEKYN